MSERKDLNFSEIDSNWTNTPGFGVLEDFCQRANQAWQRLGFDLPPVPERNKGYGRVKQKKGSIKGSFYPHFDHPWSRINFSGWDVELDRSGDQQPIEARIDTKGNLQQLRITKPLEVEPTYRRLDDLFTEARFSRGRLHFFWQEEPNGTFFPDPRGGTDQIWPFWLNVYLTENPRHFWKRIDTWDGTVYRISRNRPQLSEQHWQEYLHYVRNGCLVVSGRTLRIVRQTESQAMRNLEAWRNYIFYKSRQAFEFRLNSGEDPISGIGYVYTNYRNATKHVSKNPAHYNPLDNFETAQRLDAWELPF